MVIQIVIQIVVCLILLLLHLPTILLWVDSVVPLDADVGAALIVGPITQSIAVLLTIIGTIFWRRFRHNPFVWIINGVGIAAFVLG